MSRVAARPSSNDPIAMLSVTAVEKRYVARRIGPDGEAHQAHCIVAMDDEDALYLLGPSVRDCRSSFGKETASCGQSTRTDDQNVGFLSGAASDEGER